jgi:hypothetical protein
MAHGAEQDLVHVDIFRLADGEGNRMGEGVGGDRRALVKNAAPARRRPDR